MTGVDPEALRLFQAGRFGEALGPATRAVAGASRCLPGHALLATVLWRLGRDADADEVVRQALSLTPGGAEAYDGLAYVSLALGRHERANELYRRLTSQAPRVSRHWYNLACSERSFGRLEAAEDACDRAIEIDPTHHATWLLRSELRVQTAQQNHIAPLRAWLSREGREPGAAAYLGYALAKELDDLGDFEAAFTHFQAAAAARRSQLRYDVADDERRLARIASVFAGDLAPRAEGGERCVFVMGLPRSGTTLVERILGGLAGVRSNGETENLARALSSAAGGAGDPFERARRADPQVVATAYARLARVEEAGETVIEKLPTNYLYIGVIRRALPRARLLLVRRSALDSCFAMYRTLFGDAYPFSYDWQELARYYAAYDALAAHWRRLLGDALHEIAYEELVADPGVVGARLAAHCGLAWSPAALDLTNNQAVSLTASAAQVRRPVYGSSSGRWRHYRRFLTPLVAALRARGVGLPEDA